MTVDKEKILSRLHEVTRSLDSEADLESCLRLVLSTAVELTGSETASLLEYDEAALNFFFKFTGLSNASITPSTIIEIRLQYSASSI